MIKIRHQNVMANNLPAARVLAQGKAHPIEASGARVSKLVDSTHARRRIQSSGLGSRKQNNADNSSCNAGRSWMASSTRLMINAMVAGLVF
jgi:hypothetical protein